MFQQISRNLTISVEGSNFSGSARLMSHNNKLGSKLCEPCKLGTIGHTKDVDYRDVRNLRFCTRRIGKCAQNWP